MKTIIIRSLSGLVYITAILLSIFAEPYAFFVVGFIINAIAIFEYLNIASAHDTKPNRVLCIILSISTYILTYYTLREGLDYKYLSLLLLALPLIASVELFSKKAKPLENLAVSIGGVLYITLPLACLNIINLTTTQQGYSGVLLAIFVLIWTNDTFAYLTGMMFGKHPLFVRVSPKKTWEGLIGGMLFAIAGSIGFHYLVGYFSLVNWIIFALLIVLSATFGDFFESLLKRQAGIKDSGKIMPGHGGILDRIDSVIFAAPIILIFLQLLF